MSKSVHCCLIMSSRSINALVMLQRPEAQKFLASAVSWRHAGRHAGSSDKNFCASGRQNMTSALMQREVKIKHQ